MIIYVWPNGDWCYDFMFETPAGIMYYQGDDYRAINLDRLYEYKDLTKEEIKACEDALSD